MLALVVSVLCSMVWVAYFLYILHNRFVRWPSGALDDDSYRRCWAASEARSRNRDGYDDVVVGAPWDGDGSAYLFLGGAGGVDADSEDKLTPSDGREHDFFGHAIRAFVDVTLFLP